MNILTVVGARPQFVKAEALGRAFQESGHAEFLLHTGQHWDACMSDRFFHDLDLRPPDVNLGVGPGPHGAQTGKMLAELERVVQERRPDWVVVVGDTNSTLAGALAAAKVHLPVAHVEAGLRSFNRRMPEEVNRVLTDHASDLLFAPTRTAVENLRREGFPEGQIAHVGDVMYDTFLRFSPVAEGRSRILAELGLARREYVLATLHRAENTDDPARLSLLLDGLRLVGETTTVVLPLHPRTRQALKRCEIAPLPSSVRLIEPVGYLDMLQLEKNASVIATDSGGVQKEAFFARVPCVTLRDETEWTELVELGWNTLCPPRSAREVAAAVRAARSGWGREAELYGGGQAARRIAALLGGR